MIYTLKRDDMPLLSHWIKKAMENVSFSIAFLAQREGFEPSCGVIHKLISSPFGNLEVIEQYYPKLAIFQ